MTELLAAIGLAVVVAVGSAALGCLLALIEIQWPGFTDKAGQRVWGRDIWRDQ
jgi:hypothetical protein